MEFQRGRDRVGCPPGIRTPISRSRICCPAVERGGNFADGRRENSPVDLILWAVRGEVNLVGVTVGLAAIPSGIHWFRLGCRACISSKNFSVSPLSFCKVISWPLPLKISSRGGDSRDSFCRAP